MSVAGKRDFILGHTLLITRKTLPWTSLILLLLWNSSLQALPHVPIPFALHQDSFLNNTAIQKLY